MRWVLFCLIAACGGGVPDPLDGGPPDAAGGDAAICGLTPRDECCHDDGDCKGDEHCYGAMCTTGQEGRCKAPAPPGMCWSSADCPANQQCVGASICECAVACLVPDEPGTCQ